MGSFLDMAPTTARFVVVGKNKIPVPGIKAKGIAYLVKRYLDVITEAMGSSRRNEELILKIIDLGDDVIAAIIACGCGYPGSEDAEVIALALPLETQVEFLTEIIGETLPNGPIPFVEKVMLMIAALKINAELAEPQKPIKLRGKPSAK